ncbi:hypothetical protein [Pseudonocardia alaniniphila]|uniref:DDE superfamily endonuclease n=1 Tax=Pseudonocardia alaniniphila TaxID=75291 RepID=A0ABS9TCZ0_9PSEU|nr:hypothetical protein [Pseudonocardia alaniniphila]MCH6166405.1 hypothetical protein [Pseudonocardia alaniniphila]
MDVRRVTGTWHDHRLIIFELDDESGGHDAPCCAAVDVSPWLPSGPPDDTTAVTANQLGAVVERLAAAGHWHEGDPDMLIVMDPGYDVTRPGPGRPPGSENASTAIHYEVGTNPRRDLAATARQQPAG